jgi:hypothetical protein
MFSEVILELKFCVDWRILHIQQNTLGAFSQYVYLLSNTKAATRYYRKAFFKVS